MNKTAKIAILAIIAAMAIVNIIYLLDAKAQEWFPNNAVTCDLNSITMKFGTIDQIATGTTTQTTINPNCKSNAYPLGYGRGYHFVQGGYCLTIDGQQRQRYLTNGSNKIPLQIYNYTGQEIGNGQWGATQWNWGTAEGNKLIDPNILGRGIQFGSQINLDNKINMRNITAKTAGQAPEGEYTAELPYHWITGQQTTTTAFPLKCSEWKGTTGTGILEINATIKNACKIDTTQNISFGTIPIEQSMEVHTASGAVAINCTAGQKWTASISKGLYADQYGTRAMQCGSCEPKQNVQYLLWQDSQMSKPWTDKPNEQETGTGTGKDDIREVYASTVKRTTPVTAGKYSDTVIITVTAETN